MEARGPGNRRGTLRGWFWFWILSPVILPIALIWGVATFIRDARRRGGIFLRDHEAPESLRPKPSPIPHLSISKETWAKMIEEDARIKGDRMLRSLEDEEARRGP